MTGRSHCYALLTNLCDSFNSKLGEGCDTPIITCLEFIEEYIMKKIVNVEKEIARAASLLILITSKTLEKIKLEVEKYVANYCGNEKYQVVGSWND